MSEDPRDTQFAGFGMLLWEETMKAMQFIDFGFDMKQRESFDRHMETLYARRAYDLVKHTVEFVEDEQPISAILPHVPDLTEWTKENT